MEHQLGLVTLAQQRAGGTKRGATAYRRVSGRYQRAGRGVDRLAGSPRSFEQDLLAGCLAAGDRAVLSHRTAAHLWGLGTFVDRELTVPYRRSPVPDGMRVHRLQDLDACDVTVRGPLQLTTVARTLIDVGAGIPDSLVAELVRRALGRNLVALAELHEVLERLGRKGRRGAGSLRRVLDARALGSDIGESELEELFADLCRRHGLPSMSFQHELTLRGRRVRLDFAYPERNIAIEIDGFEFHSGREVFESDRERQNLLTAAGWRVVRITYRMLLREPTKVAALISSLL